MIRALIIDDEQSGCEVLENLIELEHPDVQLFPSVHSISEGVASIEQNQPELIFLDIKLNGRSGFEILEKTAHLSYEVIFVTAYSEYALKAIKASALDYLLKPVSRQELGEALARVRKRSVQEVAREADKQQAIQAWKTSILKVDKIALPSKEGYELCPVSEILYLVADRNYTEVHVKGVSAKVTTRTLGTYEEQLANLGFFRIHKSYIVNLNEIQVYSPGNGGYVKMTDGRRLEVSRRRKKELLELIDLEQHSETVG